MLAPAAVGRQSTCTVIAEKEVRSAIPRDRAKNKNHQDTKQSADCKNLGAALENVIVTENLLRFRPAKPVMTAMPCIDCIKASASFLSISQSFDL
jgi:hypothetical protein